MLIQSDPDLHPYVMCVSCEGCNKTACLCRLILAAHIMNYALSIKISCSGSNVLFVDELSM